MTVTFSRYFDDAGFSQPCTRNRGLDAAARPRMKEGKDQAMKLSIKGLALASGILWGVAMLGMGLANLIWGGYGQQFLQTMSSVYFG